MHRVSNKCWFELKKEKEKQCFLKKWLIPGLGWEMHKMCLEHLLYPKTRKLSDSWGHVNGTQEPTIKVGRVGALTIIARE